ncbi:hypothetical protein BJV78DRAFT_1212654 [Lactifluus subvellereus]|nr:hypothetical protein BJV78DRAFT_1212654 [Lactifluus subvellereus]
MPRAVLVDLPLERFLQPVSDVNLPTPPTGSKRSRSPSLAQSIFSPAKRRILEQEGLFLPSHSRPYPSTSARSLRPRHRALLHGLDGSKHPLGTTPTRDTLLPTPTHVHPSFVIASPCEQRRISPRLSASPQSQSPPAPAAPTRASPRRRTRSQTTPTMIPREMPPSPDRQSLHYPGFDVHPDTHIALPCTRSKARAKEEAARVQEGGDAAKENVRPVVVSSPPKGKVKGDATPRRSARLRTNNGNPCTSPQKVAVFETRGRERRRGTTLYESSLQF